MVNFAGASSNHADTAVASVTVPWPSTTNGDIVVLAIAIGSAAATALTPSPGSWTAIDAQVDTNYQAKCWWHRCDGTESGNITVSWSTATSTAAIGAIAYSGLVASGSPIDVHGASFANTSASSRSAGAAGNCSFNDIQVTIFTDEQVTSTQSWTPPASMNERVDVSSTATPFVSVEICEWPGEFQASSSIAGRTATSANAGLNWVGFNMGLRIADLSSETQVYDGSYSDGSYTPGTTKETFIGCDPWPDYGQGWPRVVQR